MADPQTPAPTQFVTLPDIARQHGLSRAQLERAVESYHIDPDARVGITRVYTPATVERIVSACRRTGATGRRFGPMNWRPSR